MVSAVAHTITPSDAQAQPKTSAAGSPTTTVAPLPTERFIPVTALALVDRLTVPSAWPNGDHEPARRFFRYLDFWRRQQHNRRLMSLLRAYEPFDPDSDLLITRQYTPDEKRRLQKRAVSEIKRILERANYVAIDPKSVEVILTKDSHYGLDLHVDLGVFEECLLYYRGASKKRDTRTNYRKFLRKEEFDVPIYRRLVLLFKLKPFAVRVKEVMAEKNISEKEAAKIVTRMRGSLPTEVKEDNIYIKLFKNIPRNDLEMVFPNTRVRFRLFDKIKLGVTGGGAVGMGLVGTAGKAGGRWSDGGQPHRALRRGCRSRRHRVPPGRQLHEPEAALHGRDGAEPLLPRHGRQSRRDDQAFGARRGRGCEGRNPALQRSCERNGQAVGSQAHRCRRREVPGTTFDIQVDFDLPDALERLIADGIVREDADGTLHTLPPIEAARHLDAKWDRFLDDLPDGAIQEGLELDAEDFPLL